jgi:SAM-dependent methyltransferase
MVDWATYFGRLAPDSPLYREQSAAYVKALTAAIGVRADQRVLDFGCGFGFVARMLAPRVAEVWFWDPSPNMRRVAERITADVPNARFLDIPAELAGRPDAAGWIGRTFDLILVNSVAQYMAASEFWGWLPRWRSMMAADGMLVLSDLIAPAHGGLSDIADLLRFGARRGWPLRAAVDAVGGIRNYWLTSRNVPLLRVGRDELIRRAAESDLNVEVLARNLTHLRKRWTAVLRPRSKDLSRPVRRVRSEPRVTPPPSGIPSAPGAFRASTLDRASYRSGTAP